MASILKTDKGYRAFVAIQGKRKTNTFRTKREADAWAARVETEIRSDQNKEENRHKLHELFQRYAQEVSPHKRGTRWERIRIEAFLRQFEDYSLSSVTPEIIGQWRDNRLSSVSAGSVLREFSLLSAIFEHGRKEWRWIASNPVADVRKPRHPDHRERIISWQETKAMLQTLGYSPSGRIQSVTQSVAVCFLFALRTGMRAGEICGLTWDKVKDDFCILPVTKTKPRNVPLDWKDFRLIGKMKGFDRFLVFGIKAQTLDALFRRARVSAGLSGFTFHDARHAAATRLARRLDLLDLCKVFGWSNPKQAMIYYNPTASALATRKASKRGQSQ